MRMNFSAVVTKGDTAYVAYCPELGVTSQGRTEKTAINNLTEAVELYLEDKDVQEMLRKKPLVRAKVASIAVTA